MRNLVADGVVVVVTVIEVHDSLHVKLQLQLPLQYQLRLELLQQEPPQAQQGPEQELLWLLERQNLLRSL